MMYHKSVHDEDGGITGLLGAGTRVCWPLMSPAGKFITDISWLVVLVYACISRTPESMAGGS